MKKNKRLKKAAPGSLRIAIGRLFLAFGTAIATSVAFLTAFDKLGGIHNKQDIVFMGFIALSIYIYACYEAVDKGKKWGLIQ